MCQGKTHNKICSGRLPVQGSWPSFDTGEHMAANYSSVPKAFVRQRHWNDKIVFLCHLVLVLRGVSLDVITLNEKTEVDFDTCVG